MGVMIRDPIIYEEISSADFSFDRAYAQFGTGNIDYIDPYTTHLISQKFASNLVNLYDGIGLRSKNANILVGIWNSFRLHLSFNNLFEWGERNRAGEMPFILKYYLHLLNNPSAFYNKRTIDELIDRLV